MFALSVFEHIIPCYSVQQGSCRVSISVTASDELGPSLGFATLAGSDVGNMCRGSSLSPTLTSKRYFNTWSQPLPICLPFPPFFKNKLEIEEASCASFFSSGSVCSPFLQACVQGMEFKGMGAGRSRQTLQQWGISPVEAAELQEILKSLTFGSNVEED